jgi:uncharacterized protein YehS (DUF1456 family)
MIHNDVLRSVRYMLDISDNKMVEIIKLGGMDVTKEDLLTYLKKDEEEGFVFCPDEVMAHFLDGLVIFKRGKDESRPPQPIETPVTNNIILKKAARGLRTEGRRHARDPQGRRVPGVQA